MSPRTRKFSPEYAAELLRLAEFDLESAQILQRGGSRPATTLFLVQQSVEKALKSKLVKKGLALPLSHDLRDALDLLKNDLPPGGHVLEDLTPFATIRRYEEGHEIISDAEITDTITLAQQIIRWAAEGT